MGDDPATIAAPAQDRQRRKHDSQIFKNLIYRLKTGVSYKTSLKVEATQPRAPSTVYHWVARWSEEGVLDAIWKQLLSLLEAEGKLDLREGSLDGSFVS